MPNWRGIRAVAAGAGLHVTLGTLYCIGNLSTYYVSYICEHDDNCSFPTPGHRSEEYTRLQGNMTWLIALAACGQGTTMYLGGELESRFGPRIIALTGGLLSSFGVFLAAWGAETFITLLLTQGIIFGMGIGLAYSCPLAAGWKWFPESQGLVTGVTVAGFGLGACIFNPIQSWYINPDGLSCEYGCPREVTDRLPDLLRLLATVYVCIQILMCFFICNPPVTDNALHANHTASGSDSYGTYQAIPTDDGHGNSSLHQPTDPANTRTTAPPEKDDDEEVIVHYRAGSKVFDLDQPILALAPSKVFVSRDFVLLYLCFGLCGWGSTFVSANWKLFGNSPEGAHISSDLFLSSVGACASIFNALGRIVYGRLFDFYGFRRTATALTSVFTFLLLTFYCTRFLGKAAFFAWVCGLFSSLGGVYAIFPGSVVKKWPYKPGVIYGVLFTANIVVTVAGSIVAPIALTRLGWASTMIGCGAGSLALALLLIVVYLGNSMDATSKKK